MTYDASKKYNKAFNHCLQNQQDAVGVHMCLYIHWETVAGDRSDWRKLFGNAARIMSRSKLSILTKSMPLGRKKHPRAIRTPKQLQYLWKNQPFSS